MKAQNIKNNFLNYCKLILLKVSFSKKLFWKEYRKSRHILSESESHSLKRWMIERFEFQGRIAKKFRNESVERLKNSQYV